MQLTTMTGKAVRLPLGPNRVIFNPSMIVHQGNIIINCRYSNHLIDGNGGFTYYEEEHINSRNLILICDMNWHVMSITEIHDMTNRPKRDGCLNIGLEDCQLFVWQDMVHLLCTLPDHVDGIHMALFKLDATYHAIACTHLPAKQTVEKNWLPFVQHGIVYIIYKYQPLTIYQLEGSTLHLHIQKQMPIDGSKLRGSGGPVMCTWRNITGYLIIVHEVVPVKAWVNNYYHRFLFFDIEWQLKGISEAFVFRSIGIEFCRSMIYLDDAIYLGVGIMDREAWIFHITKAEVDTYLHSV